MTHTTNPLVTGLPGDTPSAGVTTNSYATGLPGTSFSSGVTTNHDATGLPGDTEPPSPDYAAITSVGNGLIKAVNFSDPSITTATAARNAIIAFGGPYVPALGKFQLITDDPVFPKVVRITPPMGDFALALNHPANTAYGSVRLRLIVRLNNYLASELSTRRLWSLAFTFVNRQLISQVESSGNRSLTALNVDVASLTSANSNNTALRDDLLLGELREIILEFKDNGDNTYTMSEYQTVLGEARVPVLTRTSNPIDYDGPITWDFFWFGDIFATSAAGTVDIALMETDKVFTEEGELIPIANLGTSSPIPEPPVGPDGKGIMGADPDLTPLWYFNADEYEDDAALRADIRARNLVDFPHWLLDHDNTDKNGTGGAEARFQDGRYFDLMELDESVTILGKKTVRMTIAGINEGDGAPTCEARSAFGDGTVQKIWVSRRDVFPTGFTTVGDADSPEGIAYNQGLPPYENAQAAALKLLYVFPESQNDRAGSFVTNTDDLGIQALSNHAGVGETLIGDESTRWNSIPGDTVMYIELFNDGANKVAITYFRKVSADPNSSYVQVGDREVNTYSGSIGNGWAVISMGTENHNQSCATDKHWNMSEAAVFSADGGANPWGIELP